MRRLLVTGGSGYLGRELVARARDAGWDVVGTSFSSGGADVRLDVRDADAVERLVASSGAVVHTAYVQDGPDAWDVTVRGSANVARSAGGRRLVHLSTDVVFDGRKGAPYVEEDPLCPVNEYGRAKAEAERRVSAAHSDALVVRTSLVYGGAEPSKHELAALAADRTFFTDEIRTPIHVGDLALALLELLELDVSGPLHVAGDDAVSRHEFARLVRAAKGHDPDAVSGEPATVPRPLDCALDSSRAQKMIRTRLRGVRTVLT